MTGEPAGGGSTVAVPGQIARHEDRPSRHGLHGSLVDRKISAGLRKPGFTEARTTPGEISRGDLEIKDALIDVDRDAVTIFDKRNWASHGRLGRYLGDGQPLVAQPGQLTVTDECNLSF